MLLETLNYLWNVICSKNDYTMNPPKAMKVSRKWMLFSKMNYNKWKVIRFSLIFRKVKSVSILLQNRLLTLTSSAVLEQY